MTTWNTNIQEAPRETVVKRHGKTRSGQAFSYEATEYTPVILASKCGKVIRSYWIEKESRWAGLANGEQPDAWMAWPEHPGALTALERLQAKLITHKHTFVDDVGSGA